MVLPRTRAIEGELAAIAMPRLGQMMPQPLKREQAAPQSRARGKHSGARERRVDHPQGRAVVGPIHLALDDAQNP